jgi:hypothetical protein
MINSYNYIACSISTLTLVRVPIRGGHRKMRLSEMNEDRGSHCPW